MWSNIKYPNLELLEYKTMILLRKDEEFQKIFKAKVGNTYINTEFDAVVFPQIWGSTCSGFDITKNGEAVLAPCAMTKEYTTVFHELLTDIYVVFFGDAPCYTVHNANEIFLKI